MGCSENLGPTNTTCTLAGQAFPIPGVHCLSSYSGNAFPDPGPGPEGDCKDFISQCLEDPCKSIETYLHDRDYSYTLCIYGGLCCYSCVTTYAIADHECVPTDPPPPECTTTSTTSDDPNDCNSNGGVDD
jgi:hypothetical protein